MKYRQAYVPYSVLLKQHEEAQKLKNVLDTKVTGTVKWFSLRYHYGFIARDDGKGDVFVHQMNIVKSRMNRVYLRSLATNEKVEFDVVEGKRGPEASNVTGPDGTDVQGVYVIQLRYPVSNFGNNRRRRDTNNRNNSPQSGGGNRRRRNETNNDGDNNSPQTNGGGNRRRNDTNNDNEDNKSPQQRNGGGNRRRNDTNNDNDDNKSPQQRNGGGNRRRRRSRNDTNNDGGNNDDNKSQSGGGNRRYTRNRRNTRNRTISANKPETLEKKVADIVSDLGGVKIVDKEVDSTQSGASNNGGGNNNENKAPQSEAASDAGAVVAN